MTDVDGVWLRNGGRLAGLTAASVAEVTRRGTGVSPVVNPANGGMEQLYGQDAHATKIQPHPVDDDVVYVSPTTVYRVLKEEGLVAARPRRKKVYHRPWGWASTPDEKWQTDLRYVKLDGARPIDTCIANGLMVYYAT
jgi:hypothetical protein